MRYQRGWAKRALKGLRSFASDTRGVIGITFAAFAVCIVVIAGAGTDYALLELARYRVQTAVDEAAVAALSNIPESASTQAERSAAAKQVASGVFIANTNNVFATLGELEVELASDRRTITVSVAAEVEPAFIRLVGISKLPFRAEAAAFADISVPACVLALRTDASPGITFTGQSTLLAPDCIIWSNSTSSSSISFSGQTKVTASKICAVGNVTRSGAAQVNPSAAKNCAPLTDPYALTAIAEPGSCTSSSATTISAGGSNRTLNPGVYCGGLTVSASNLTLNPGVYFIKNGPLNLAIHNNLIGSGVTIVMAGTNASINITAQGRLSLSSPAGGLLVTHARSQAGNFTARLAGGASLDLQGSVYLPNYHLTVTGGSASTPQTSFIAGSMTFDGNGTTTVTSSAYVSTDEYMARYVAARILQ